MAFTDRPASRGKHRRPRRIRGGATLAGVAALTTAGALGGTAAAAPAPAAAPAHSTVFTQALDMPGALAHTVDAQAAAQQEAATAKAARTTREAAARALVRAKAEAAAKAGAAAKARAATRSAAARASRAAARAALNAGWMKPVGDAPLGTGYKASGSLWASGSHTGVDFLVGSGTSVHAVAAGTVVSAGWDGSYGNDVIIRHADGKYTLYGHLSRPVVSAGQTVTEGQQIGVSGATGNVTGPHLHFEVRTTPDYGSDIDPVAYMRTHGVII